MAKKKRVAPTFRVGQHWYLRLPKAAALTKVQIIDRTPKVVEIIASGCSFSSLYAIADLEFVEKLTDQPEGDV